MSNVDIGLWLEKNFWTFKAQSNIQGFEFKFRGFQFK